MPYLSYCPSLIVSTHDHARIEQILSNTRPMPPGAWLLQRKFCRATLVAPHRMPPTVVTLRSKVLFVDLDNACEYGLTLACPDHAKPEPGAVSVFTPVGAALLGLAEGQDIHWVGHSGRKLRLRVLRLVYQPEADGSSADKADNPACTSSLP